VVGIRVNKVKCGIKFLGVDESKKLDDDTSQHLDFIIFTLIFRLPTLSWIFLLFCYRCCFVSLGKDAQILLFWSRPIWTGMNSLNCRLEYIPSPRPSKEPKIHVFPKPPLGLRHLLGHSHLTPELSWTLFSAFFDHWLMASIPETCLCGILCAHSKGPG